MSFNTPEYSRIPQSAVNGFSNARNLAKLYGIVANGGKTKGGVLLSQKAIERLQQPLVSGKSFDGVINADFGYGVGTLKDERVGDKIIIMQSLIQNIKVCTAF